MKKLFSILLLIIYLFNLVGYSLYYHYHIRLSEKKIAQQIDNNNYCESELVELKIPLNLPYYNSFDKYERIDGEITLNNVHHNYVKRKIVNDTMYLMCLPNLVKTQLYTEKNKYASQKNDLPANGKQNQGAKKTGFRHKYVGQENSYAFAAPMTITHPTSTSSSFNLLPGYSAAQCQPPDPTA